MHIFTSLFITFTESISDLLFGEWYTNTCLWVEVDLFVSEKTAHCPLFHFVTGQSTTLEVDVLVHKWPHVLLYTFPPLELIILTHERVREKDLAMILIAPRWPGKLCLEETFQLLCARVVELAFQGSVRKILTCRCT